MTDGRTVIAGIPSDDERDFNAGAIALFARAEPFQGEFCLDSISFVDGEELTIEGTVIRGVWRNYDGEGSDAPLVGIIRDGLPIPCHEGPAHKRDNPQNPAKAYAACLPEYGCMVGIPNTKWFFVFDGLDGTYDLGFTLGDEPPGACAIDDVQYQILPGPCPFKPQAGGRTSSSLIR